MADELMTLDDMAGGKLDFNTLKVFANGDENTVNYPRLLPNVDVGSIAELRKKVLEKIPVNATSFKTKADLTADTTLADNSFAFVHNDATAENNGLYQKVSGAWVYQKYNAMAQVRLEIAALNIKSDAVIHDELGNVYDFAGINNTTQKLVSGLGANAVLIGDLLLKRNDGGGFEISDKNGKTAFYIDGNGVLRYPIFNNIGITYVKPDISMLPRLDIIHIVGNGQSLGDGSTSNKDEAVRGMEISKTQPYANLMLAGGVTSIPTLASYDGTAFAPLIAGLPTDKSSANESPLVNTTNALTKRILSSNKDYTAQDWVFCASYGGQGGQSIETLDGNLLANVKQQMTDVATLAKAQSKSCAMWFYQWHGNESQYNTLKNSSSTAPNSSPTADSYMYEQKVIAHYDKIVRHAVETYPNQTFLPYLIFGHQVNHASYNIRKNTIAIAQWRMSKKYPFCILAVPVYQFTVNNRDFQHLQHAQAWLLGEYIARAEHYTMTKDKWRPCEPVAVKWTATHIDVEYYTPHGKLVIDNTLTYLNTAYPNAGFDIWTDDDTLDLTAISSVAVLDDKTIRITLNSPITTQNAKLTYGRGRDGDIVSGGNVRDSHGDIDKVTMPDGTVHAMHNASVMFEFSKLGGF